MFKSGSVNGRRGGAAKSNKNQSKASEQHQTLLNSHDLEMTKEIIAHIKNMQSNKMNIVQHIAKAFYRKYSNATPSVSINIFKNGYNLITYFFSVIVIDYKYIHYVIKLRNFYTCN